MLIMFHPKYSNLLFGKYVDIMCLNPLHIKVKSVVQYDGGFRDVVVACGKCAECQSTKTSAMLIRCKAELDDSVVCYFDTLTYNEQNIPSIDGYKCFSRDDVQKFMKRLRRRLARAGFTKDVFKFLIVSEYGGLTQRPHYHVLFFLKVFIPLKAWKKFVNDSWQKGFTDHAESPRAIVKDVDALNYCVKYVFKDVYTRKREFAFRASYALKHYGVEHNELLREQRKEMDSFLRSHFHFFQTSRFFGCPYLEKADLESLLTDKSFYFDKGNVRRFVQLPRYFYNKVFKEVTKVDNHFCLTYNKLGLEFGRQMLVKRIEETEHEYNKIISLLNIRDVTAKQAAVYSIVYRGRSFERNVDLLHMFDEDYYTEFYVGSMLTSGILRQLFEEQKVGIFSGSTMQVKVEKLEYALSQIEQYRQKDNKIKSKTADEVAALRFRLAKVFHR